MAVAPPRPPGVVGLDAQGLDEHSGHHILAPTAAITEAGTSPQVAHVYLISDLHNGIVVEVAMWSTSPPAVEWPTINDDQLLAAMVAAPLCTAYVNSCAT